MGDKRVKRQLTEDHILETGTMKAATSGVEELEN